MSDYDHDSELMPAQLVQEIEQEYRVPTENVGQVSQAAHQGTLITFALNPSNPVVPLLGRDYERAIAYVIPVDGPIFVGTTEENVQSAMQAGAQPAAGTMAPQLSATGFVPQSMLYPWASGEHLYAAMVGATPTRVSVQIARRLPGTRPRP